MGRSWQPDPSPHDYAGQVVLGHAVAEMLPHGVTNVPEQHT